MCEELDRPYRTVRKVTGHAAPCEVRGRPAAAALPRLGTLHAGVPSDVSVRATFEDSGYTLCVLMGKRCAREAAEAAERYLRTNLVTCAQEQPELLSPSGRKTPSGAA